MFVNPMIPQHLADVLEQELEPGERLEWSAMPKPTLIDARKLPLLLFAVPWTAFALFWTGMAFAMTQLDETAPHGMKFFFPLFGVPFILIGLGMLLSPFWSYRRKRNTVYAITDRRALVIQARKSVKVDSYGPERLRDMRRVDHRDGTGSIYLKNWGIAANHEPNMVFGQMTTPFFERIDDARDVQRMLRELADRSGPGG